MKFINITGHDINAYGYRFRPGNYPVDVKEDNLVRKFLLYKTLQEVTDGLQEQRQESTSEVTDAPAEARTLSREELKALLDERNIKYSEKTRTKTLQALLDGHQDTIGN